MKIIYDNGEYYLTEAPTNEYLRMQIELHQYVLKSPARQGKWHDAREFTAAIREERGSDNPQTADLIRELEDMQLTDDAREVFKETGRTPRQLADERAELIVALRDVADGLLAGTGREYEEATELLGRVDPQTP